MYCPTCGTQNLSDDDIRFCRSCGADLRAVSQAMTRSFPVRVANALDAYFENRYQQNLRNGILNLLAFFFLLIVGSGYLISGWTGLGIFMLVLSLISIITGVWDIWIYKRNLPPVSRQTAISSPADTKALPHSSERVPLPSVTESTTKHLDLSGRTSDEA